MQKLNYPLKIYIKAIEILLEKKGFGRVEVHHKSGSAVRFDLFLAGETTPHSMWVVHAEHTKSRKIISKEDYKKAARCLNSTTEEFIEILEAI